MRLPRWVCLDAVVCALLLLLVLAHRGFGAEMQSDVNTRDPLGRPALLAACDDGDIVKAKALIEAGADVNLAGRSGMTPLGIAAANNRPELITLLIASGAAKTAPAEGGKAPLLWAVSLQRTSAMKALLAAGADVNVADRYGRTPLMYGAYGGNVEIVEALLKAGAEVNSQTAVGTSTLMFAAWSCRKEVVEQLIQAGAKAGPKDWLKDRPPQFADFPVKKIYSGRPAAVDLHSNPNASEYRTRLRQAARKKSTFAGHYIVADWGCGSNCQSFTFIDSKDGKVYSGTGADRGADFRADSSLFIADPPFNGVAYEDDTSVKVPIRYFVLQNNELVLIFEQACKVENSQQKCGCDDVYELVRRTK